MNNKWEPKHWLMLIAVLGLTGIVTVSILRDRIVNQQYRTATVMGRGKISYTPDMATINVGVQVDKKAKAEEALGELNRKMTAVRTAILKLGIKDDKIDTKNYSLSPQYDYKDNIQTVSGYSANQQLAVKVENLKEAKDMVNRIITEAGKAGANQINGIVFDTSNLEDYKQQARVKAIADAKTKAGALAGAAGVELGSINGWYENLIQGGDVPYYDAKGGAGMGAGAVAPNVGSPTNEIVIEIGLTYNLGR